MNTAKPARGLVTPYARRSRVLLALATLGTGCSARSCDLSGFDQLSSKDPRAIDLPGVDIALVGSFTPCQALGRDGVAEAVAGVDEDGNVRIVRFDGSACTATRLVEGTNPGRALPAAHEDLLATLEDRDETERGRVRLFDLDCKEPFDAFAAAAPVAGSERLVPFRLLLQVGSDLVAVDAARRSLANVEQEVVAVDITSQHVIVQTARDVAVFELSLEQVARFGTNVTEMVLLNGSGTLLYVDDGVLWLLDTPTSQPRRVDRSVCAAARADGPSRTGELRFLSYYKPCADKRLLVYDLVDDAATVLGASPSSRAVVQPGTTQGEEPTYFYLSNPELDVPQLSVKHGDAITNLGSGTLEGIGARDDEGILVWLAEPGLGDLVRWSPSGVEELVPSVIAFEPSFPARAVLRGEGMLVLLEGVKEPRVLATSAGSTGRSTAAFTAFFDSVLDDVGDLKLLDHESFEVTALAEAVRLPSAGFWFTGQSLFYLSDYDRERGTGELCMRVVESGDKFCEPGVAAFRVLNRPERGVALVKTVGDERRLFWAAVE